MTQKPSIVLLSGGLDSATVLACALREGGACHTLAFRYGQRHSLELEAAADLSRNMGATSHRMVDIDLSSLGGSSLTGHGEVPKGRSELEIGGGVPTTYVPARNTVFLSFALAWAEVLDASRIYIGVNAVDYSGYPDCRPEFIEAFERLANLATRIGTEGEGLKVVAPLQRLSKSEIIRLGTSLGVDYSRTRSCYDPAPDGRPCLRCDSCQLRLAGFAGAGLTDPLLTRFGLA
ncbi:MAG: 7-cyano-7-deazaguanine synthase QueC [Fibrobacterota bacterium]|nr:7-cyano-7-deazaguanine synthase QueC [Fibrobacterota bacterium]QQS05922.1 MAG: 7-cyano-7-deazaguanine synthase QueC [Fibrobacterota bacterium]